MKISELMTTRVVAVRPDATLKEVASLLTEHRISGLPVVDGAGRVLGVISEADILHKERRPQQSRWRRRELRSAKSAARTVGEAMSSPAVTILASRRVDVAASAMLDRDVNRLPVVDDDGVLVGIVTRADLVRAFAQTDDAIAHAIEDDVLRRELWLSPEQFEVDVHDGEVTVVGGLATEAERSLVERRVRLVPGVVSVDVR
jgi:CBS domain-containing protein